MRIIEEPDRTGVKSVDTVIKYVDKTLYELCLRAHELENRGENCTDKEKMELTILNEEYLGLLRLQGDLEFPKDPKKINRYLRDKLRLIEHDSRYRKHLETCIEIMSVLSTEEDE